MEIFTRKEGGQRGKRKERLFGARTLICVCVWAGTRMGGWVCWEEEKDKGFIMQISSPYPREKWGGSKLQE